VNGSFEINYAPLHLESWPGDNTEDIVLLDKIQYRSLQVTNNSCRGNGSENTDLNEEQANSCLEVLQDACTNTLRKSVCPCYSHVDIKTLNQRIGDVDMVLDQEKTCNADYSSTAFYGIHEISDVDLSGNSCPQCSKVSYAALKTSGCVVGNDTGAPEHRFLRPIIQTNQFQSMHCHAMMDDMCSNLKLSRGADLGCEDDDEYQFRHRDGKNCPWAGEKNKELRCSKMDTVHGGKRVFESCRSTCGYCDCEDNTSFRFNASEDKDCNWVKADAANRCALYGVSDHCKSTCGAKCCRDDLSFQHKGFINCSWAGKNPKRKKFRCAKKVVARNCPETCGLCALETS